MRPRVILCAVITLLGATVAAAQPFFGDPFPLTNVRYVGLGAETVLASNGHSAYLFWKTDHGIRVTRNPGELRVGRPVLAANGHDFDVVWTGTHFLVVAESGGSIIGCLVDSAGETVGGQFTVLPYGADPKIATDGTRVRMLFHDYGREVRAALLSLSGRPLDASGLQFKTRGV